MGAIIKFPIESTQIYGQCLCGSTDFKLLIEKPNTLKIVGIQCSECQTIAMFEEDDYVIFEPEKPIRG